MATVGVVCERVRLEEKQLLTAFAAAGLVPAPFPPTVVPLSLAPGSKGIPRVVVDRGQNRVAAVAILTACRALGAVTLDAGLAARADRLAVATTLTAAGLPRPETRLTCGAEAALATLADFGFPATVLPLVAGGKAIRMTDMDTAEAVLEHRDVLGSNQDALSLIQAGVPLARWSVVVVGGVAVATMPTTALEPLPAGARALAEAASATLGAAIIAVEIARVASGLVVWDVDAVPEFRQATPISEQSVAAALAELALARIAVEPVPSDVAPALITIEATHRREVGHGVVLTA
jgi:[lysine-biosynthesis-protein LysW]--L-2-aminoadipate ligase